MNFHERLKELLKDVKDAEFSRKSGISQSSIGKYKEGRLPRLDAFIAIAETAKVNYRWLATGEGDKYPDQKEIEEYRKRPLEETLDNLDKEYPDLEFTVKKRNTETEIDMGEQKKIA